MEECYENIIDQITKECFELIVENANLIKENKVLKESKDILDEMTDELIKEVDKLVNKKINRLEALKKRTKRLRIKKKCESKILEQEKRYLD